MPIIVFEGVDGSGKSSLIASLSDWILTNKGIQSIVVRQPGFTPLGEQVRNILKGPTIPERVLHLLLEAARVDILLCVERIIKARPGAIFLFDRHSETSYAYQVAGGVSIDQIFDVQSTYNDLVQPDFSFLLDIDVKIAKIRLENRGEMLDRFDSKPIHFFEAVRSNYLDRFHGRDPSRYYIIDASKSPEEVLSEVITKLESLCKL